MKKLSFRNKFEAVYMAKEYGVRVLVENLARGNQDNGEDPYGWTSNPENIWNGWIDDRPDSSGNIHPDDYKIFETQGKDLLWDSDRKEAAFLIAPTDLMQNEAVVQRNGKPFFWPEIEFGDSHRYLNSVHEVIVDDITIGFIARRSVIVGIHQEVSDGWMITKKITQSLWSGNFETRKEARLALERWSSEKLGQIKSIEQE